MLFKDINSKYLSEASLDINDHDTLIIKGVLNPNNRHGFHSMLHAEKDYIDNTLLNQCYGLIFTPVHQDFMGTNKYLAASTIQNKITSSIYREIELGIFDFVKIFNALHHSHWDKMSFEASDVISIFKIFQASPKRTKEYLNSLYISSDSIQEIIDQR